MIALSDGSGAVLTYATVFWASVFMSSADRSPAFYSCVRVISADSRRCDDPEQRTPQPYEQRNRGGVTNDDNRS